MSQIFISLAKKQQQRIPTQTDGENDRLLMFLELNTTQDQKQFIYTVFFLLTLTLLLENTARILFRLSLSFNF